LEDRPDHAFAVVHLIEMAREKVEAALRVQNTAEIPNAD